MRWYWYVLIGVGTILVSTVVSAAFCMFEKVFRGNSDQAEAIKNDARSNPDPVVQMRIRTLDRMQSLPHENWEQQSADGLTLRAGFYPNGANKRVAIILHGWRSAPWWDYGGTFELLYEAGYAVLAVSQRALYESDGRYVTYGVREKEDLLGWIDLTERKLGKDVRIVLLGVSMGATTVLMATGEPLPASVRCAVSDCAFARAKDLFRAASKGWLPVSRLAVDLVLRMRCGVSYFRADAVKAVRRSVTPTYFLHGDADEIVPYPMMEELYAACAAEKEQWTVPHALHGEAYATDPDGYRDRILPFLARYMGSEKND